MRARQFTDSSVQPRPKCSGHFVKPYRNRLVQSALQGRHQSSNNRFLRVVIGGQRISNRVNTVGLHSLVLDGSTQELQKDVARLGLALSFLMVCHCRRHCRIAAHNHQALVIHNGL